MGLWLPSVLLLLSVSAPLAAGVDFQPGSEPSGQPVFVKRSHVERRAASVVRGSLLPAWLSPDHGARTRRSAAELGDSCGALQGFDTKLAHNTHRVS